LKDPEAYGNNFKGKKSLSKQAERQIVRIASNSTKSAAKIKELAGVRASLSTLQRTIRNSEHLKRLKIKKKPPLNVIRKEKRL